MGKLCAVEGGGATSSQQTDATVPSRRQCRQRCWSPWRRRQFGWRHVLRPRPPRPRVWAGCQTRLRRLVCWSCQTRVRRRLVCWSCQTLVRRRRVRWGCKITRCPRGGRRRAPVKTRPINVYKVECRVRSIIREWQPIRFRFPLLTYTYDAPYKHKHPWGPRYGRCASWRNQEYTLTRTCYVLQDLLLSCCSTGLDGAVVHAVLGLAVGEHACNMCNMQDNGTAMGEHAVFGLAIGAVGMATRQGGRNGVSMLQGRHGRGEHM